jgi:taurine dioxygenase
MLPSAEEASNMADPNTASDHDRYNSAAMGYAVKLHEARAEARKRAKVAQRSPEQLFPRSNRPGLGVALEYERMGNRPVSEDLLARAGEHGVEFEHLGITLGTVLHNISLQDPLSPAQVQLVRDTLLERKVIFFRDQHLSEAEQVAFSRQFGELDAFPFGKPGRNPYILEIVHDENSPGTENGFHTDVTWMERPSLGSVAQCVELPPLGGDTLFSDSHACYLGLPVDLQRRIEHLHGINDYRIFIQKSVRGVDLPDDLVSAIKADIPFGVSHPLVRTHPETGKRALYLNAGFLRHDSLYDHRTGEQLGRVESEEIVRQLMVQHDRPEYVCRFRWEEGSIVFWDNRAVQHYAASDYYPHRRVLRRVTISGDKPYCDPVAA